MDKPYPVTTYWTLPDPFLLNWEKQKPGALAPGVVTTVEQLLKKAKTPTLLHWDQKTVKDALAVREELVPKLLEHMNWYYEQLQIPDWDPDDNAFYLNYNGYHLLAEMQEPGAYPILLKFLALPIEIRHRPVQKRSGAAGGQHF